MAKHAQTRRSRNLADRAWLLMMLPALFWAGNAVVGRAVAGEVPPIALAFWRWAVGTVLLLPLAWRHLGRDVPAMARAWPILLVLSALGISVYNTFLYIAAQTTTALNIVMLQSIMPVLIVGFTFLFFREKITARQALGVVVSIAGALTLVTHGVPSVLTQFAFNRGDLWMLAAVVSYAMYTALLRRRPAVHGLSLAVATFAIGAFLLLPFYVAETISGRPLPLNSASVLAIGYVSVFASILSYLSYNRAVALVGPNTAGLTIYLVPVFGTVLAIFLLGEVPRLYHGVGIALIAIGIVLATRKVEKPGKAV
jgi:drug/metabolite transporter (DMT)-like permease